MTLNEYAIKLGLSLNSAQIQILDLIEERKDDSLIITFPRISGRQLMYDLVQRKKGYDEGFADATRWIPVSERLPESGKVLICTEKGYIETSIVGGSFWVSHLAYKFNEDRITHWMPLPEAPKGEVEE